MKRSRHDAYIARFDDIDHGRFVVSSTRFTNTRLDGGTVEMGPPH